MKQFSKKTFLGLDLTPRRLMWARIARLEEQAGRFAADRELAFRLVAELDAKLRKLDQPRQRGRFASKRVQPVAPVNAVADVPSDAWAEAAGCTDLPAGLSASARATSTTVFPANTPDGFSVTVSSEFSGDFPADAAGFGTDGTSDDSVQTVPGASSGLRVPVCERPLTVDSATWPSDVPAVGFADSSSDLSVRTLSGLDAEFTATDSCSLSAAAVPTTPVDSPLPSCAAPASPSSPSGSGASAALLSFGGSAAAEAPKSRRLPS